MSQNRQHMSAIGREGGESRAASQTRRRAGLGSEEVEVGASKPVRETGLEDDLDESEI